MLSLSTSFFREADTLSVMLNEFISILAAAVIGALPAPPPPEVTVRYADVEKTVLEYLESDPQTNSYEYAVDCHQKGTAVLTDASSLYLTCDINNVTLNTTHPANVSAFLEDEKLQVTVVISEGYVTDPSEIAETSNQEDPDS